MNKTNYQIVKKMRNCRLILRNIQYISNIHLNTIPPDPEFIALNLYELQESSDIPVTMGVFNK